MVMRQMRENTKWIMLVTALAFVALMVFEWGMDLTGRSGTQLSGGEAGRVNGQPISYEDYSAVFRNLYDQQSAAMGGQNMPRAMTRQIEDAAWDQIVMQRLISQELRRRGIEVSETEIRQTARFAPPPEFQSQEIFLTDGQFDLNKYHAFLASPSVDTELLLQLEAYYRDAIPRTKLYYQNTAGIYVTDNELWRMWRDQNESARVRYIPFDPAAIVPEATVTVSDEEIRRYYEERQGDFIRPASARVKYLMIDRTPTPADTAAAEARARALRAEIAAGSFEEVVRRTVEDSAAAAAGGQGTIVRGQTYPALEQVAFAQRPGILSDPVLTPAGYHILRVDNRSGDTAQVHQLQVPIRLTEEAEDLLFDKADSVEVLAETLRLDEIGRQFNFAVRDAELIPGLAFVPGLGMAEDGMDWAFEDAEQPGEVSEVFETPSAYYVFELTDRQDERTLTLAEATPTIRTALVAIKRTERAKETVRQALDRLEQGRSMEQVAAEFSTTVEEAGPFSRGDFVPGLGRLNPAIGTAFGLRTGQISGVVEADRKLYLIALMERTDANRAEWEAQKADQRRRVTQAMAEQRWNQFLTALREDADIVDGRRALERQSAAQAAGPN